MKQKENILIELKASNVTIGFGLGHDLHLVFSKSNMEFAIFQPKCSDCHETKSKHIDWTLGLKCDHQVWPWPWPWPWIFKVKYGICHISTKSAPIATKWKANISIELHASNVTRGFDFGLDLDFRIFKVKCDLDLWPHAWPWPRIFMSKFWHSCISEWEGLLTLSKRGVCRSFMTMTIWWPRSGVRIYKIVTGVKSDVGMPSTHLVFSQCCTFHGSVNFLWWLSIHLRDRIETLNPLIAGNAQAHTQHHGYWCPGVKAPGHFYL